MKICHLFRVNYNVQNDSELQLAEAELKGLVGKGFRPVRNFVDLFGSEPFCRILHDTDTAVPRLQDVLTRLPYPGSIQGYLVDRDLQSDLVLFRQLSFFRDFFAIGSDIPASDLVQALFPNITIEINRGVNASFQQVTPYLQVWESNSRVWVRVVPLHTFQECSEYAGRLARKPADVERMFSMTLNHLANNFDRPFVPSVNMGFKWIEDFIDDRRAPMSYLSHAFFGLRGRFFPRMVRALINYMAPKDGEVLLDPFCGVGTLGVEATIMGLNSINSDINPLFTLVGKVKTDALGMDTTKLRTQIETLLTAIQEPIFHEDVGQGKLRTARDVMGSSQQIFLPPSLSRGVKPESIHEIQRILNIIDSFDDSDFREFARVPLVYAAKSMLRKYTARKISTSYWGYLWRMFYSLYFESKFRENVYRSPLGHASFICHDIRQLQGIIHKKADVIITSPPYATAVDYVGNDSHSLYLLGLVKDHLTLDRSTIGSLKAQSGLGGLGEVQLPECVVEPMRRLLCKNIKKGQALKSYYEDMGIAFSKMKYSLKAGKKLIVIIGSEQYLPVDGSKMKLPLSESMKELGTRSGLEFIEEMRIELAKNTYGSIFTESVLVFGK